MKVAMVIFAIVLAFVSPFIGGELSDTILLSLRIPRALLAFIAGGGLSFSGLIFQSLFKNPLASPFTLGVASGASFGASLAIALGVGSFTFLTASSSFAFLGALLSVFFILSIARMKKSFGPLTLLLGGVIISLFFSSLTLFIQAITREVNGIKIMHWMMGGIDIVGFDPIYHLIPFVLFSALVAYFYSKELNLLSVSENFALGKGVETERVRIILFISTSLMIAAIVAECGPLGFVGLIPPHIVKNLFGRNHRLTLPISFVMGGTFLILCDFFTRLAFQDLVLPLGVVTSLLGGPFFLYLLLKKN